MEIYTPRFRSLIRQLMGDIWETAVAIDNYIWEIDTQGDAGIAQKVAEGDCNITNPLRGNEN